MSQKVMHVYKKLEKDGNTKKIYASRIDSSQQINKKIQFAFGTNDYTYLECINGGHKLLISSNQSMDGRDVIERCGCLYLFKVKQYYACKPGEMI